MNHALDQEQKEYAAYVERKSPPSHLWKDGAMAFVSGGLFCVIGQAVFDLAARFGADEKAAATIAVISMIFLGALLTGLGVYDLIGKYAGAGSVIPITGFANSIVAPAMEFKREGLVLGVGSKMFTVAGPVLVYGIGAAVIVGIIFWIGGMVFG